MKNILILLVLCSCDYTDADHWEVAPELKDAVDQFYIQSAARGIYLQHQNMQMGIGQLEVPAVGRSYGMDPPVVIIDETFLRRLNFPRDSLMLQYIVFHELGHAMLGRDHANGFTIMTPHDETMANYCSNAKERNELINELFRR
jgi:hypothetical protein